MRWGADVPTLVGGCSYVPPLELWELGERDILSGHHASATVAPGKGCPFVHFCAFLLVVFHTPAPQLGSARKHILIYHLFFFGRYDKGTVVKVPRQVVCGAVSVSGG